MRCAGKIGLQLELQSRFNLGVSARLWFRVMVCCG